MSVRHRLRVARHALQRRFVSWRAMQRIEIGIGSEVEHEPHVAERVEALERGGYVAEVSSCRRRVVYDSHVAGHQRCEFGECGAQLRIVARVDRLACFAIQFGPTRFRRYAWPPLTARRRQALTRTRRNTTNESCKGMHAASVSTPAGNDERNDELFCGFGQERQIDVVAVGITASDEHHHVAAIEILGRIEPDVVAAGRCASVRSPDSAIA